MFEYMNEFWNGFEKRAGLFDTTIKHVIGGAGQNIPLSVKIDPQTLEAVGKGLKGILGTAGALGFIKLLNERNKNALEKDKIKMQYMMNMRNFTPPAASQTGGETSSLHI